MDSWPEPVAGPGQAEKLLLESVVDRRLQAESNRSLTSVIAGVGREAARHHHRSHPGHPSSLRFAAARRVLVSNQTGERTRLACSQRRPRRWHSGDGDCAKSFIAPDMFAARARRTTRGGACAPRPPSSNASRFVPVTCHSSHPSTKEFQDGDRRDACPTQTVVATPEEVREQFRRVKPLKDISVTQRGWTLDVLNAVLGSARASRAANDAPVVGIWGTETAQNRSLHPICSPRGRAEPQAGRPCSPVHPRTGKAPSVVASSLWLDLFRRTAPTLHPRDAGLLIHLGRGVWVTAPK
jgi:hypothetical protein